jgi:hypothetical protein
VDLIVIFFLKNEIIIEKILNTSRLKVVSTYLSVSLLLIASKSDILLKREVKKMVVLLLMLLDELAEHLLLLAPLALLGLPLLGLPLALLAPLGLFGCHGCNIAPFQVRY